MSSGDDTKPDVDVLVLGASFAGVELVYQLHRSEAGRRLRLAVVDRQREHSYIPLCHERLCRRTPGRDFVLATSRYLESLSNVDTIQDEVVGFDPHTKTATLGSGRTLRGRFVVVGLGSVSNPPGDLAGREHLLCHKLGDELNIAERRLDEALRKGGAEPNILVVGGRITGVEIAGELAHLRRNTPAGWTAPRVTLIEGADRLLVGFTARAGRKTAAALRKQGVEIRLGARLAAVSDTHATIKSADGGTESIRFDLAFWAGGVHPAPALEHLGLPRDEHGWLTVGPTLQCFPTPQPSNPDVFACGDAVTIVGGSGPWNTMRRAIEAIWQAELTARNILTLAAEPPDYPDGVPPLRPHVPRGDFPYGVSLGGRSLVVYGPAVLDLPLPNTWFRRFLMREYLKRYTPPATVGAVAAPRAD